MDKDITWIWQSKNWPDFIFNDVDTKDIYHSFGELCMAEKLLSPDNVLSLKAKVLEIEAISTSILEGEVLDKTEVQSAVFSRLGLETALKNSNVQTDSLINLLVDVKTQDEALTPARLFAWHQALFPVQKANTHPIVAGMYRSDDADEIKIVSGTWHKEVVHYLAPASSSVEFEMNKFLLWLNTEHKTDPVIKSAVAHIWFLFIHPFKDGNRRLARDISDYVLSSSINIPSKLFTLAFEINEKKSQYYETLDSVCAQEDTDISAWVNWYITILSRSLDHALLRVDKLKAKALLWDKLQKFSLNERQRRLISKLLNEEIKEKELKTSFYAAEFSISKPTAARDLKDLQNKKILKSFGAGRGVYYRLREEMIT